MKRLAPILGIVCILMMSIFAELAVAQSHPITLTDINGRSFSTADGLITTVVIASKANVDKAHAVGERIPDFCLGNPKYRMITVIAFEANHSRPIRAFLTSMVRRRVESAATQLQARYDKLKIAGNARQNVLVVTDFDGTIAARLDAKPTGTLFHVFVFGKNGELLKQWSEVPSAEELAAVLKTSD